MSPPVILARVRVEDLCITNEPGKNHNCEQRVKGSQRTRHIGKAETLSVHCMFSGSMCLQSKRDRRKEFQAEEKAEAKQARAGLVWIPIRGSVWLTGRREGNAMQNNIRNVDSVTFRPNPTLHLHLLVEAARGLFVLF